MTYYLIQKPKTQTFAIVTDDGIAQGWNDTPTFKRPFKQSYSIDYKITPQESFTHFGHTLIATFSSYSEVLSLRQTHPELFI